MSTIVYLDSVNLPDVVINDEFGDKVIDSYVERTLDGTPIIWEQALTSGQFLNLTGGSDFAWISRGDLITLKELASVPYATYTLTYGGIDRTVRFRNEEFPVISATPLVPRINHENSDWYNNLVIKLMVV